MHTKVTFVGIALALTTLPLFASADTLSDLQAQIQVLTAELAQLQQQAAQMQASATPSTSVSGCLISGQVLSLGSSGENVSCLQKYLAQDPSVYPEGLVTGYYGPLTMKAVQRYQTKMGIVSSGDAGATGWGIVGPVTRSTLTGEACNGVSVPCASPEPPGSYYVNLPPVPSLGW